MALIEATGFGTKMIVDEFEKAGVAIDLIVMSGGIPLKNPMLVQIYADILNREIRVCQTTQAGAVGAAMLGVDVCLDGKWLPRYWADGLIVSTSSGSTAYSLSVGGPIVLPQSKVLILAPIAPHNLNIRPLVVPDTSEIRLRFHSRDGKAVFTMDNRTEEISSETDITVSLARFSLRRVRFNNSDFINALTEKLFWGEDVRNIR
jgi:hypothetical protein